MKKIGIMTDSHSGILSEEAQRLGIKVLPMPFYIGEKVYREGVDLSRDEFYDIKVIDEIRHLYGKEVETISWYNSNQHKSFETMKMKKLLVIYV